MSATQTAKKTKKSASSSDPSKPSYYEMVLSVLNNNSDRKLARTGHTKTTLVNLVTKEYSLEDSNNKVVLNSVKKGLTKALEGGMLKLMGDVTDDKKWAASTRWKLTDAGKKELNKPVIKKKVAKPAAKNAKAAVKKTAAKKVVAAKKSKKPAKNATKVATKNVQSKKRAKQNKNKKSDE